MDAITFSYSSVLCGSDMLKKRWNISYVRIIRVVVLLVVSYLYPWMITVFHHRLRWRKTKKPGNRESSMSSYGHEDIQDANSILSGPLIQRLYLMINGIDHLKCVCTFPYVHNVVISRWSYKKELFTNGKTERNGMFDRLNRLWLFHCHCLLISYGEHCVCKDDSRWVSTVKLCYNALSGTTDKCYVITEFTF